MLMMAKESYVDSPEVYLLTLSKTNY